MLGALRERGIVKIDGTKLAYDLPGGPEPYGQPDAPAHAFSFANNGAAPVTLHVGRHICGARTIATVSVESIMNFAIECEFEDDGRWLAEAPQLPGVLAYGSTRDETMARAQVPALRVLAERLEHGESRPESISISVAAA